MKINVTIPVFNEQKCLADNVHRVIVFLKSHYNGQYELVIADNASDDRTLDIAHAIAQQYDTVRVLHLEAKGRGRALKQSWLESRADILCYMDVDLSTGLECFPGLIETLMLKKADICAGSRLLASSITKRGLRREIVSRGYNILVKALFHPTFSDAQCGFKSLTRQAADELLPMVQDDGWFFDTELLLLAEHRGYRVHDLPVRWIDDSDSRVQIIRTVFDDIRGLLRLRKYLKRRTFSSRGQETTVKTLR